MKKVKRPAAKAAGVRRTSKKAREHNFADTVIHHASMQSRALRDLAKASFYEVKKNVRSRCKIVMAFGTFDIVHEGHIYYLREAKKLGDYLVVVVSRDENAFRIKGKKPVHNENARLAEIKKLGFVDKAVLGDRAIHEWKIIKKHKPYAIALGYDQIATKISLGKKLSSLGLHPMIARIKPFKPETYKTSRILKR